MKTLFMIVTLIAITTLELQATNPCLCEYFQYIRIIGDSTKGSNVDLQQIDTCEMSSDFGKIFTKKAKIIFTEINPCYSSSFNAGEIVTENIIDSVNFPFTKVAIKKLLTLFGSATLYADSTYKNFNLYNKLNFNLEFNDYVKLDVLDSISKNLDTVTTSQQKFFLGFNTIKILASIKFENESFQYRQAENSITFNEIYDEVILTDFLGRSNSFKLTDKINLQEMKEKIYFLIARKGDKYFKTKLILE